MANEEWEPRRSLRELLQARERAIPNLDDLEFDDLQDWAHHLAPARRSETMAALSRHLGAQYINGECIQWLYVYATNAAKAKRASRLGEKEEARRFEARCEEAYSNLPANMRW